MNYLPILRKVSLSIVLSVATIEALIRLKNRLSQPISEFLASHKAKAGTPIMGGLGIFIPYLLFYRPYSGYNFVMSIFVLGLFDDLVKLFSQKNRGLSKSIKFILSIVCIYLFASRNPIDIFILLCSLAGYGITDGLDGLLASICLCVFALWNFQNMYILLTSLSVFLVYNWKPARIFMGECGALTLGALAGYEFISSGYKPGMLILSIVPLINLIAVSLKIGLAKVGVRYKLIAPIHHEVEKHIGEKATVALFVSVTLIIHYISSVIC